MYTKLNDASVLFPMLAAGNINILYQNNMRFGDEDYLISDINTTHVLLGTIKGGSVFAVDTLLNAIFGIMQGENWSPNGEACNLINSLDLSHTSMSVGDIIQIGNDYHQVKWNGFSKLIN